MNAHSSIPGGNAKKCSQCARQFGNCLQTKHTPTIYFSNHASCYLPKRVKNLCLHRNLPMNVYSSFIHKCQKFKTTKMSFNRWENCGTSEHGILFSDLKNQLLSHIKTWRNKKLLLSERNLCEKPTYCMIPVIWHSGKGKNFIEAAKRPVVSRNSGGGKKGWVGGAQRIFTVVKPVYMTL